LHVFQFGVAAQIALLHGKHISLQHGFADLSVSLARRGKLVTHDVYSEIVFCLSARKNVREAFATFGFQSSSRNAVVVLVNPDADTKESVMKKIAAAKVCARLGNVLYPTYLSIGPGDK
jgi:tRNA threonylcarbamoyladenosine modification (KEOPS) complex Cgi121 subunit